MNTHRLRPQNFRELSELLFKWTGIRLYGKEQMVEGRLAPRLRTLDMGFTQYIARVKRAGPESSDATDFINALTTNKTSFFREPHHFDFLREKVIEPAIAAARQGHRRVLRFWSAASSTGEEPYSLAMLCHQLAPASEGWDVKILATDIDTAVIQQAQRAIFDRDSIATVPPKLATTSFLDPDAQDKRQLRPEIVKLVHFKRANLIADPFPVRGSFHAVLCRNVMIYFDRPTQEKVVANLLRQIRPGGYLIVGHSESLVAPHLKRAVGCVGVYEPESTERTEPTEPTEPTMPTKNSPEVAPRAAPAPVRVAPPLVRVAPPVARPAARIIPTTNDVTTAQKSITVGEVEVSASALRITTLLGSCVAACLYDPVAKIGGMNHFLLPSSDSSETMPARFGVQAMELLINRMMSAGAKRDRLVAKVFGAARVAKQSLLPVAEANARFIREFLSQESIPILVERLGGTQARSITLDTASGKVEIRCLANSERLAERELEVAETKAPVKSFNIDDALF